MSDVEPEGARPDPAAPSRAERPGRRRARPSRRHTVVKVLLSSLLALAMVTGLSVVFIYRHLNDNLTVVDVTGQLGDRPEKQGDDLPQEPLNILVMGSDTRACEGCDIDQEGTGEYGFSDTTILMHLSADRERAYGISIPRDSLVDRPECTTEDGETIPGQEGAMWNAAFQLGGPACTLNQFEEVTGVFVDHYVVVNFQGFQDMVDALDGVEVCIPEDIEDPSHGISIPAGTRELEGQEALNYVRARYTLGDGSDLGRIKRQQAFIAAMAKEVVSSGTLARLDRLVAFLNAATKSLTVDEGLGNVWQLGKMGLGFQGIGLDNIQFVTVPWQYAPEDPNRVAWLPEADQLWRKVIADEPLTRRLTETAISAGNVPGTDNSESPSGSGSESPSGTPSTDDPSAGPSPEDEARQEALAEAGLCV